jgi:hypothetical protein
MSGAPSDAFRRAVALLDLVERTTATDTEPWSGGTAFFQRDFPKKYALNFLRLDAGAAVSAGEVVAEAERVQGGAGLEHRRVNGYGSNMEALAPAMDELGWEVSKIVMMVHDGAVRPLRKIVDVSEVSLAEIRPAMVAWDVADGRSRDTAEMLADSRGPAVGSGLLRFFAGAVEGEIAGWCELWRFQEVAQVENVMTFEHRRNLGVASSVVNRALSTAYSEDATLAFLLADSEDWPQKLYRRLGFEPIGFIWEFTKTP